MQNQRSMGGGGKKKRNKGRTLKKPAPLPLLVVSDLSPLLWLGGLLLFFLFVCVFAREGRAIDMKKKKKEGEKKKKQLF
jgi:hypothetical protein